MAKNDLARLGIFSEPGYITISDKYVPKNDDSKWILVYILCTRITEHVLQSHLIQMHTKGNRC